MEQQSLIQANRHLICVVGERSSDLCLSLLKAVSTIGRSSAEIFRQQEPFTWTVGDIDSSTVHFKFSAGGYETSGQSYTLVNFPSFSNAIKMLSTGAFGSSNRLAGSSMVSAMVLVVEAEQGLSTNLIQAAQLGSAVGIGTVLAFIDQSESDDAELIDMCQIELLEDTDIPEANILAGQIDSALDYQGTDYSVPQWQPIIGLIELLNNQLDLLLDSVHQPLFAPICQVDDQQDETSILTCQIKQGVLVAGQAVDIIGLGDRIRTECIRVKEQNKDGLLSAQVYAETGWVLPGLAITTPKKMRTYFQFVAAIYSLTVEEAKLHLPLIHQDEILVNLWFSQATARLNFAEMDFILSPSVDDEIQIGIAEIWLEESMPMYVGAPLEIQKMGQLVAMGTVIKTID